MARNTSRLTAYSFLPPLLFPSEQEMYHSSQCHQNCCKTHLGIVKIHAQHLHTICGNMLKSPLHTNDALYRGAGCSNVQHFLMTNRKNKEQLKCEERFFHQPVITRTLGFCSNMGSIFLCRDSPCCFKD